MSLFIPRRVSCPACATEVAVDLVVSVNAGRRDDLRAAILDGSFQRETCPACATQFRVDPEFVYIDVGRGLYIGVWPVARRGERQACAERTQADFDRAYGSGAPAGGRSLGEGMQARAVFGWPALIEKILAQQYGVDDRTLEVAKVTAMRSGEETPVPGRLELRLVGESGGDLLIAWVRTADQQLSGAMRLPRAVLAEIEAEPAGWQTLRDGVADGPVIDFQREMLAA